MGLEEYNRKRKFKMTSEPQGRYPERRLRFVIQRHAATRLHYDLRLEAGDVLKSWAIPKGPSLNPNDKRMAVRTEDHPIDYLFFEGEIPKGSYGAGMMEIWDDGYYYTNPNKSAYYNESHVLEGIKGGSFSFFVVGKKIRGKFNLVRIKKENNKEVWLLLKAEDEYSIHMPYSAEEHISPYSKIPSAITKKIFPGDSGNQGEGFSDIINYPEELSEPAQHDSAPPSEELHHKSPHPKKIVDTGEQPAAADTGSGSALQNTTTQKENEQNNSLVDEMVSPMLCHVAEEPFDSDEWIFEMKWDGYRALANISRSHKDECEVLLYSRNKIVFNDKYPAILEELKKIPHDVVLDGEIVVLGEDGHPNFHHLQNYEENKDKPILYYIFDLLYLDGTSLMALPLTERKKTLQKIIPESGIIKISKSYLNGIELFKKAEKERLEGIIAKKADSKYKAGSRSRQWLKIKHQKRQEAVIAGFTEPQGSRSHFGSLILGTYEGGRLKYIGNAGSGFDENNLQKLYKKMKPLVRDRSPFQERFKTRTRATWLNPALVCEVSYSELTPDHHLRHPVFLGLREDKQPKEVSLDYPEAKTQSENESGEENSEIHDKSMKKPVNELNEAEKVSKDRIQLKFDQTEIPLSNPDKVLWPKEKYTKRDLVNYYLEMADFILPHLVDRPQSLNRYPDGIDGDSFYQKDVENIEKDWMETIRISSESSDKETTYLLCQNKATLAYMANLGCIEINPWLSRKQHLNNPDYVVVDLDPADNSFEQVIEAALHVKQYLDKAGAESYCKTSGSSGLHIYIPLGAKYDYETGRHFTHIIAELVHTQLPEFTSTERNPSARKKQIYLDYLQNVKGKTLASVYSVRPRPGATVSTPLEWKEVKPGLHPSQFTIKNVPERVRKKGDLFKGVLGPGVDLLKCLKRLGA